MAPRSPYHQVLGHYVRALPDTGHERATHSWLCEEVARLLGVACAHDASSGSIAQANSYHVPDDTLTREQARALGMHDASDLLGGIVPHAFLATKVISHPLVDEDSARIDGWSQPLAQALIPATLPGYSVFSAVDAQRAYAALRGRGRLRFKLPTGIGGKGQWLIDDEPMLLQRLRELSTDYLATHGAVLELNLHEVVTHSVGELCCAGVQICYYGTQHSVLDRDGEEVYGGSDLEVRRGTLETLASSDLSALQKLVVSKACVYDRFIVGAYPELQVSRRNYDVVTGCDEQGTPMCGVLEQSWRVGGATPAELAAVACFQRDPSLNSVRASTHESFGDEVPGDADVYYRAPSAASSGPRLKYRRVSLPRPIA